MKNERKSAAAARLSTEKEQRRIRNSNRGNVDSAHWGDCDATLLRDVVQSIAGRGCAVQFGFTRDGGAFAIRIVGDGEPYSEYVRPSEDIDLYLRGLLDDFTNGSSGK